MSNKLREPQKQIPGGFQMYQPEIKWQSRPWSSLDGITNDLISARKGNPVMTKKYGWSTDPATVLAEVEAFQVRICQTMGYTAYLADEGAASPPPPKPMPPHHQSNIQGVAAAAKKIWAGVKTLNDWLDSGEPGVPAAQSAQRASVCVSCPLNGTSIAEWFTKPAAEMVRRQLERVQALSLSTPHDDQLKVCTACECPMRLKVHTPMKYIQKHLKPDVVADLKRAPACWILAELKL